MAKASAKPKTSIGSKRSKTRMPILWVAGSSGLFVIRFLPFRSGCEADRMHKRVFGGRRHGGAERRKDHSPSIVRSPFSYRPTVRPAFGLGQRVTYRRADVD